MTPPGLALIFQPASEARADSNDPAGQEKLIKLNTVLANLAIFRNAWTSRTWYVAWSKTGPALPASRRYPARHPDADGYDQLLTCKPERYRLLPRPRDACLTGAPGSGTMGS